MLRSRCPLGWRQIPYPYCSVPWNISRPRYWAPSSSPSSLLVHSQNKTGIWDVFPAGLCLPQGEREKSRLPVVFTQGLFDFLGRFWSYFPSQGDHRGNMGSGTQFWP